MSDPLQECAETLEAHSPKQNVVRRRMAACEILLDIWGEKIRLGTSRRRSCARPR